MLRRHKTHVHKGILLLSLSHVQASVCVCAGDISAWRSNTHTHTHKRAGGTSPVPPHSTVIHHTPTETTQAHLLRLLLPNHLLLLQLGSHRHRSQIHGTEPCGPSARPCRSCCSGRCRP